MNSKYKWILFLVIAIGMAALYSSCSEEQLANDGKPMIRYVRITKPTSSDSLLVSAFQSNLIAIVGENLQDAEQVWFNDLRGAVNPNFISSTSILTSTPGDIPKIVDNKMRIIFSNGDTLIHDFKIEVSKPEITSMNSEYVNEGGIAFIRGSFFYEPLTVTFTGGAIGELESVEDNILSLKVPAGAQPGPVTITTNFGSATSNFWFRDNRNIIVSSDPFTGWWNSSYVVSSPAEGDPAVINGNYIRVQRNIGAWTWLEVAGGPPDAMGDISKNIPDEAILKPSNYYLKFEVNTMKPYSSNGLMFNFGLSGGFNDKGYAWIPPYDTKGEWETVVIPFEDLMSSYTGVTPSVSKDGYYTRIVFLGAGALDADISFDNFRVVPKVLKK